jgi:hypothetical protein
LATAVYSGRLRYSQGEIRSRSRKQSALPCLTKPSFGWEGAAHSFPYRSLFAVSAVREVDAQASGAFLSEIGRLLPFGALECPGGVSLSPGAACAARAACSGGSTQPERASRVRYGRGHYHGAVLVVVVGRAGCVMPVIRWQLPERWRPYGVSLISCWFRGAALHGGSRKGLIGVSTDLARVRSAANRSHATAPVSHNP